MQCVCGSTRLRGYHRRHLEHIFNFVRGHWVAVDPAHQSFFHATSANFTVDCYDCRRNWSVPILTPQFRPGTTHREITLDLDHTLFSVEWAWPEAGADLVFPDPQVASRSYYVFKRPHLDEFMQELFRRFDKVNIFTAAQGWYAEKLVAMLAIPVEKQGFVKTIKDTHEDRPLSFEREYMKPMSGALVVEDKPLVVDGYDNTVIKVTSWSHQQKNDRELLRVLELLGQTEQELPHPETVSGQLTLFLRDLVIPFKEVPWEVLEQILRIPSLSQTELSASPIRTSYYSPYFVLEGHSCNFSFSDLTFANYQQLKAILQPYTRHRWKSARTYAAVLTKRVKALDNNF